ncbi:MAG: hypothetical protein IPK82_34035 [Polyangiaceae bacterium]|nr:hypothetical protein [Polyangiaceae bacterium]
MKLVGAIRGFALLVSTGAVGFGCAGMIDAADPPDVGDDPRALPERAAFKVSACGVDELRERVCGTLPEPVDVAADAPFLDCPADPKRLASAGPTMLFYTDTKKLEFDRLMTLRFRHELSTACGGPDGDERKGECCFSRCTPMPTAAESTRIAPAGYTETTTCIDAPQGGTMYPAEAFSECPNAIVFGVGPLPFEADPFDAAATARARHTKREYFNDVPRCCYRTIETP